MESNVIGSSYKFLTTVGAGLLVFILSLEAYAQPASNYGQKQTYSKGVPVVFADFDLTYLGTRHIASPVYKRGFNNEEFQIERAGEKKVIFWSSGTGDIGPAPFDFGGRHYELELSFSDKLGRLKEHEVVVWKR